MSYVFSPRYILCVIETSDPGVYDVFKQLIGSTGEQRKKTKLQIQEKL